MTDIPGSLTAATFHPRNYLSKDRIVHHRAKLSSPIPSPVINLGRKKETITRSEGLNTTPGAGGWNIIARVGVRTRFSCFGKENEEVLSVKRKQNALFSESELTKETNTKARHLTLAPTKAVDSTFSPSGHQSLSPIT
ncbi:hypothetical protein QQP08_004781, partial [Theobroma cacao]